MGLARDTIQLLRELTGNAIGWEDKGGNARRLLDAPISVSGGAPLILAQSVMPIILPSSGTMGANGALTAITALPYAVFPVQAIMYFPAGKAFAGSLATVGYYVSILSATTATVYANTYTGGVPAFPASPTAIVDAGPGAYTQATTEIALASITLPGGLLNNNGSLQCLFRNGCNNSVGAKTFRNKFGGTTYQSSAYTTSVGANVPTSIANRGTQASQYALNAQAGDSGGAGTQTYMAINSAADVALLSTGQIATATDFLILEGFLIEALPSA